MISAWQKRTIAVSVYTLVAAAVAWANRESLYYLDGWLKFIAVASIPLLMLLGYYLWDRAHPNVSEVWKKGLAVAFTVILFFASLGLLFSAAMISFVAWMTPIDNVRKYDYVTGKWNSPFTAHFPRPIPADAQVVRFHFNPGALQSPSVLELGYTTTPERIDALYREYTRRCTLSFTAGTENGYIEPSNIVAEDAQDYREFSNDYTLFYLDTAIPKGEKDWNHPDSHGVAISKQRCRVVFWAWSG